MAREVDEDADILERPLVTGRYGIGKLVRLATQLPGPTVCWLGAVTG
jgi:hypothetical protein